MTEEFKLPYKRPEEKDLGAHEIKWTYNKKAKAVFYLRDLSEKKLEEIYKEYADSPEMNKAIDDLLAIWEKNDVYKETLPLEIVNFMVDPLYEEDYISASDKSALEAALIRLRNAEESIKELQNGIFKERNWFETKNRGGMYNRVIVYLKAQIAEGDMYLVRIGDITNKMKRRIKELSK